MCRPAFFAPAGSRQCGLDAATPDLVVVADVLGRGADPGQPLGTRRDGGPSDASALAVGRFVFGVRRGAGAGNAALARGAAKPFPPRDASVGGLLETRWLGRLRRRWDPAGS